MPLYEFQCTECGNRFEELLPIRHFEELRDKMSCPSCLNKAEHVMGAPVPINTTTRWLSRQGTLLDQFGDTPSGRAALKARVAAARRAGHNPGQSEIYDPTVAAWPGDPDGFIPHDDPVGHMKRVTLKRGVGTEGGLVKVPTPASIGPPPRVPLDPGVTEELVNKRIAANPALAQQRKKVREEVVDTHSYKRRS